MQALTGDPCSDPQQLMLFADDAPHQDHLDLLAAIMYFISGGLPEAAKSLVFENNVELTEKVLSNILSSYAFDFSKHASAREFPKINSVWESIPSQLSRENKKFLYQLVKTGARARVYEDALNWLTAFSL
jgi:hypothetical protein